MSLRFDHRFGEEPSREERILNVVLWATASVAIAIVIAGFWAVILYAAWLLLSQVVF